jgi:predicted aldo/keto reductase-like oxidoreductase
MKAENKGFSVQVEYYDNYTKTYGKASDCIRCRKCEKACPQHIRIVDALKKVAEAFEND